MIIVKAGVVYAITELNLRTDFPAPPPGQLSTQMYAAMDMDIPATDQIRVEPETYRGKVVGYTDVLRTRIVDQFTFESPVQAASEGTKAVLDWLVIDRLTGGVVVPSPSDPVSMTLQGNTWVVDPAKLEAKLVGSVKARAEADRMKAITRGTAKATIYAAKANEVASWQSLGATDAARKTAWLALDVALRKQLYPYASVEAALAHEGDIGAAIARIRTGLEAAKVETVRLEAIEQQAVRAIKAASTASAKQAAFDAIVWSWKP